MITDFNAILGSCETTCSSSSIISIGEFSAMVSLCNLAKIGTKRAYYTYFKGNMPYIRSCLDHGLCFKSFFDFWSIVSYYTLLRHHFDHHLLLLLDSITKIGGPRSFDFIVCGLSILVLWI